MDKLIKTNKGRKDKIISKCRMKEEEIIIVTTEIIILFNLWATPHGMQDLSSLIRNQILNPCVGSMES